MITVINAAIAAFYYLRVVVYMYMREPSTEAPALTHGRLVWAGLGAASLLTVILGLFPGVILTIVQDAARAVGAA